MNDMLINKKIKQDKMGYILQQWNFDHLALWDQVFLEDLASKT